MAVNNLKMRFASAKICCCVVNVFSLNDSLWYFSIPKWHQARNNHLR